MKANELMIGDWVSLTKTEDIAPCVVTGLHPKELFVLQPEWSAGEVVSYDTIYPIPLTAEILEKNGWWYDIEDLWLHDGVNFFIEKWKGRFQCFDINQIKFHSVHQLQNALRLCGLNDLADNFKI